DIILFVLMTKKYTDQRITQLITKCPITQLPIRQPVLAEDGFIYERYAILKWLNEYNNTSPITRQSIDIKNLKTVIDFYNEDDNFVYREYLPIIPIRRLLILFLVCLVLIAFLILRDITSKS
ncbi:unnamed protein product, partial [Didymodactylos carnosus]